MRRQAHLSMTRYAASRRQTKAHRAAPGASGAKYLYLSRWFSCYSLYLGGYTDDTDGLYNTSHCVHFICGSFFIYNCIHIPKHSQLTPRVYITIYVIHNSCILSSSVFVFADSSANKILFLFFLLFLLFLMLLIVGCLSVDCQFACQL